MKLQEARNIVLDLARQNVVSIKDNNEENDRQWQAIALVEKTLLQAIDAESMHSELDEVSRGADDYKNGTINQEQEQHEPFDGAAEDGSIPPHRTA